MFTFSSKKGNRRREVKAAEAARHPRLERRNAVKNIDYDVSRVSTSSDDSTSLQMTRSLDLSPVGYSSESSFRIGGSIDGEVDHICQMLGLSGPEDFGIPVAAWEASIKARSSSDLLSRSRLLSSDSFPRKRENSNLASDLPAESRVTDLPDAEVVVLGEEVRLKSPVNEEAVLRQETRDVDYDAGVRVSHLPFVAASLPPAVLSPVPGLSVFVQSTSEALPADDKTRSTPVEALSALLSEENRFKPSIEEASVLDELSRARNYETEEICLSSQQSSHCDVGIKGIRPPVLTPLASVLSPRPLMSALAPPPSMTLPIHDRSSSTWDIVRSFAPDEKEERDMRRAFDYEMEEEEEEEEEEVEEEWVERNGAGEVLERAMTLVETTDGTGSFSTTNDDDSSSTTTEFVISPNGRFKKQIKSWMRGQLLGSGSFGTVYEGISDDGTFIAIKEVSLLDKGSNAPQCILQLEQEIALLSQFEHENIVQYYGTHKEESKLVIFLELVTQGSLASLYQKYHLRDTQVSAYTRQILNGLNYLHERNVVHRDIKCANILVHANGSVKLADFGLAKEISKFSDLKSCKGSVYWMAPEVVHPRKTYGRAADIWSLGCTVLELLTRQIPFPNVEWQHAFYKIGHGDQPPIPDHLSNEAQDFIRKCVQVDPNTRPTAAQLLGHPFVMGRPLENISY